MSCYWKGAHLTSSPRVWNRFEGKRMSIWAKNGLSKCGKFLKIGVFRSFFRNVCGHIRFYCACGWNETLPSGKTSSSRSVDVIWHQIFSKITSPDFWHPFLRKWPKSLKRKTVTAPQEIGTEIIPEKGGFDREQSCSLRYKQRVPGDPRGASWAWEPQNGQNRCLHPSMCHLNRSFSWKFAILEVNVPKKGRKHT